MGNRDVELNLVGHDHTGKATRSAGNNLDQLKRKLDRFNVDTKRISRRGGVDAGEGFVKSFGNTIRSLGNIAMPIVVASLLKTAFVALQAGLPLLLAGGLLALPLINLVKDNKEAVDKVKKKWGEFIDFVSVPLQSGFLDALESMKDGLEDLKEPVKKIMGYLAPILKPVTDAVFLALKDFFIGIEPAMPGIKSGVTTLAAKLPTVAKAVSDMINALLKDPEKVDKSVTAITDMLTFVARVGPLVIGVFNFMTSGLGKFANALLLGAAAARLFQTVWEWVTGKIKALGRAIQRVWDQLYNKITGFFKNLWNAVKTTLKTFVDGVIKWFKDLFFKLVGGSIVPEGIDDIIAQFRRLLGIPAIVAAFANRVVSWFKSLFSRAVDVVADGVSAVNRLISGLKSKTITIKTVVQRVFRREFQTSGTPFDPRMLSNDNTWMAVLSGSGSRTGGPRLTLGDTNVNVSNIIDGRQFDGRIRTTVVDENKRSAYRARTGRR